MIVAGFPIAVRELHYLILGWFRYALLRPDKSAASARYHFIYFSYEPDFEYLDLSLRTLRAAIPAELVGGVVLAEDQKGPFSPSQIEQLRGVWPSLQVLPIRDFEWGSPRSTHAELQLFKQVCSEMPDPRDLLVKVDSDVLFLPNPKWLRLLRSAASAIGDGHYLQHRFAQGGLYMIRREVIQTVFASTRVPDVEQVAIEIDSVGEDMAISRMLRGASQPFFFTRMMLFPNEYKALSTLSALTRREFIALHCHKDKHSMSVLSSRFGLLPEGEAL